METRRTHQKIRFALVYPCCCHHSSCCGCALRCSTISNEKYTHWSKQRKRNWQNSRYNDGSWHHRADEHVSFFLSLSLVKFLPSPLTLCASVLNRIELNCSLRLCMRWILPSELDFFLWPSTILSAKLFYESVTECAPRKEKRNEGRKNMRRSDFGKFVGLGKRAGYFKRHSLEVAGRGLCLLQQA